MYSMSLYCSVLSHRVGRHFSLLISCLIIIIIIIVRCTWSSASLKIYQNDFCNVLDFFFWRCSTMNVSALGLIVPVSMKVTKCTPCTPLPCFRKKTLRQAAAQDGFWELICDVHGEDRDWHCWRPTHFWDNSREWARWVSGDWLLYNRLCDPYSWKGLLLRNW